MRCIEPSIAGKSRKSAVNPYVHMRSRLTARPRQRRDTGAVQDRGPYVPGRIVDLSPATAEKIGITRKEGVARVEVAPISVPLPDGRVKRDAGAN